MFALIILVLCFTHSIYGELSQGDLALDKLTAKSLPFGDPDNLAEENIDIVQSACEKMESTLKAETSEGASKMFTGLPLEIIKMMMPKFTVENMPWCQLVKKGEKEKAAKLIKEINKHAKDGNPIRLGFISALDKHIKEGSGNIPDLTCQLKKFTEKFTNVFSDDHGAKTAVKEYFESVFGNIAKFLEEKKGPAAASCEVPEATANPTEYTAYILPLLKAIQKLDK